MASKYPTDPKDFPKNKKEVKEMVEEVNKQPIYNRPISKVNNGISEAYERGWEHIFKNSRRQKSRLKNQKIK